jgi:hypothetical protein
VDKWDVMNAVRVWVLGRSVGLTLGLLTRAVRAEIWKVSALQHRATIINYCSCEGGHGALPPFARSGESAQLGFCATLVSLPTTQFECSRGTSKML